MNSSVFAAMFQHVAASTQSHRDKRERAPRPVCVRPQHHFRRIHGPLFECAPPSSDANNHGRFHLRTSDHIDAAEAKQAHETNSQTQTHLETNQKNTGEDT